MPEDLPELFEAGFIFGTENYISLAGKGIEQDDRIRVHIFS